MEEEVRKYQGRQEGLGMMHPLQIKEQERVLVEVHSGSCSFHVLHWLYARKSTGTQEENIRNFISI